jgi:hypothetical protein
VSIFILYLKQFYEGIGDFWRREQGHSLEVSHNIFRRKKNEIFFIGTSTGSLLIPSRLNKTEKIKIFTSVNQRSIFNRLPFFVKYVNGFMFRLVTLMFY